MAERKENMVRHILGFKLPLRSDTYVLAYLLLAKARLISKEAEKCNLLRCLEKELKCLRTLMIVIGAVCS